MEGLNKAVSFILGLIVVVLVIAILTGRISLFKNTGGSIFSGGIFSRATPTPSLAPTGTSQTVNLKANNESVATDNNYHSYQPNQTPQTIPSTGPELFFPIVISSLGLGLMLKKSAGQ